MPYKRTYAKKRTYARKSYARKSNLAREVRLIKRTIKPELKMFEPAPGNDFNTVPQYFLLNDISTGTEFNNRIGNQISLKSVHIRGTLAIDPLLTVTEPVRARMMLVWYKEPSGYALDSTVLFQAPIPSVDSFTSYEDRKQFKVLYDKTVTMCQEIKPLSPVRISKKINKLTEFNGIPDLVSGALYWVWFQNNGTQDSILQNLEVRVFYTDC